MKYHKLRPASVAGDPRPAVNADPGNSKKLVGMWDAFIDAKKRMESEGPFLLRHLPKGPGHMKVFDACMGTGVDSIYLLKKGYAVTGNEIDPEFLSRGRANSRRENVSPTFTAYDWLKLDQHIEPKTFDAVICLGNSLTYLFQRDEQLRALGNFFTILKSGGVLIMDTRNYDYLLDERKSILGSGRFRYSGNYVYCGTGKVHATPVQISEKGVMLEYSRINGGKKGRLFLYPFRKTELYGLLCETGFKPISFFSDYSHALNYKADFYQFVCVRPPDTKPFNPYLL